MLSGKNKKLMIITDIESESEGDSQGERLVLYYDSKYVYITKEYLFAKGTPDEIWKTPADMIPVRIPRTKIVDVTNLLLSI
jgi:hypothetical protein